jgi:hypothetical protein
MVKGSEALNELCSHIKRLNNGHLPFIDNVNKKIIEKELKVLDFIKNNLKFTILEYIDIGVHMLLISSKQDKLLTVVYITSEEANFLGVILKEGECQKCRLDTNGIYEITLDEYIKKDGDKDE